ncbi:hypothetical protein KY290_025172 [Solanum tuberosum]|uniref:Uncharacterized protein n=1 Tax=Solanum tuberosum TaxID=4113 RepID=A0ABQ7USS8_SOLTU|nr:hypothetical protein KY284_023976 [Solanum tuberosum]KAH0754902.1 hypothetical protein KY290_025172 [Solanum tuberosum]
METQRRARNRKVASLGVSNKSTPARVVAGELRISCCKEVRKWVNASPVILSSFIAFTVNRRLLGW